MNLKFWVNKKVAGTPVTSSEINNFKLDKKKLFRLSLETLLLIFISLAIVGTKLFYPFHFIIGVGIYLLSFIPLLKRLYLSRKIWQQYRLYSWSKSFFVRERWRLVFGFLIIILVSGFLVVRPLDESPFSDMTDQFITDLVNKDLYLSVTAMDYLESTGNTLIGLVESGRTDAYINEDISTAFAEFLVAVSYSESLTDRHRYFGTIPYRLWEEKINSFLISYSLYVKKYEIVHRLFSTVDDSEYYRKILDQRVDSLNQSDIYTQMMARFYSPKTVLRLTGGYLYLSIFASRDYEDNTVQALLQNKTINSFLYLKNNFFETIRQTKNLARNVTEQKMFDTWFPIQKTVATAMGRTIISTRGKEGIITPEQALEMAKFMQPGDIMLQRRNWHISNVGIPGFWTHSALYTGDLNELDKFFASEFPNQEYQTFSELIATEYPLIYENYKNTQDNYPYSVIEAIEPGVILQSIVKSADADFVVVLRPKLSKSDIMKSLVRAFSHYHKPYDFNFDFDTRDALVCSELVYDSFLERLPEKAGLNFETSIVNGRKIVSPLDMANKYLKEYELNPKTSQLSFVYFLKSSEEKEIATVGSNNDFLESIKWSKFSFLQD